MRIPDGRSKTMLGDELVLALRPMEGQRRAGVARSVARSNPGYSFTSWSRYTKTRGAAVQKQHARGNPRVATLHEKRKQAAGGGVKRKIIIIIINKK
jgi:hypothetical protein